MFTGDGTRTGRWAVVGIGRLRALSTSLPCSIASRSEKVDGWWHDLVDDIAAPSGREMKLFRRAQAWCSPIMELGLASI